MSDLIKKLAASITPAEVQEAKENAARLADQGKPGPLVMIAFD